jgi:hypothetical protein
MNLHDREEDRVLRSILEPKSFGAQLCQTFIASLKSLRAAFAVFPPSLHYLRNVDKRSQGDAQAHGLLSKTLLENPLAEHSGSFGAD